MIKAYTFGEVDIVTNGVKDDDGYEEESCREE